MAPTKRLDEIEITDIDFPVVKEATDKNVIKRYIKLLEEDGGYYHELLQACKDRLLEVAPKEYYLLYPRTATDQEIDEAKQDLLNWEASVTETDKALLKSKKDVIFDEIGARIRAPVRGQEAVVARPSLTPKESSMDNRPEPKSNERYARDKTKMRDYYSAWDKVDVDAMEEEMDAEEAAQEESRKEHFAELRGQQEAAHARSAVDVGEDFADAVPVAHRRHMADSEKEKGNEAFYSKDYEEAEAYYTRSLQFCADDPSTWANRALVRLKLEKADAALEDCNHALALNPRYMKALHRKGKALYELERYEGAVKAFQEALAQAPGNTQINGDLMVARRKLRTAEPDQHIAAAAQKPRRVDDPPSAVITELPDDYDATGAAERRPAPAPGYTRVVIEEDSDSEEEEGAAGNATAAAPSAPAPGFRKVVIEDVSSDEEGTAPSSQLARGPPFEAGPTSATPAAASAASPKAGASASPPAASAAGAVFRKVEIVEESDGEDSEPEKQVAAPATSSSARAATVTSPSSGSPPAVGPGFRKVQIVEASDSEDDDPPRGGAVAGRAAIFAPPARTTESAGVAPAPPAAAQDPSTAATAGQPLCFDDMD